MALDDEAVNRLMSQARVCKAGGELRRSSESLDE